MRYKTFFTTDNKSGWKTKEGSLKKGAPDIYSELKDFVLKNNLIDVTFKEQIWLFINGVTSLPKCNGCGGDVQFKNTLQKGYGKFCSLKCANEKGNLGELIKHNTLLKYGVNSTNELEVVKEKKRMAYLLKYGVDNPMKSESVREKQVESLILNHGVDHPMKSEAIKKKLNTTVKSKYGVDHLFQSLSVKEKIKNTNQINLAVDYPTQSSVIKDKLKLKSFNKLKEKYPFIVSADQHTLNCWCNGCGSEFNISRILLNERNREGYELCSNCNPIGVKGRSKYEIEIYDFIRDILPNHTIEENNTTILDGKELDVYIPEHSTAVEFNGLYWHSELFKENDYHLKKTLECEKNGISLIHIFEDEWVHKKDIVKSRLANKFGLNQRRIFARKCKIQEINGADCKTFLNENHIQGNCKSNTKLGMYYLGELVAVMTFSNGRIIMGGKPDEVELVRFCNKLHTNVIGGASRLFKYFASNYQPTKIISYADKRWSNGGLYETLGFEFIHDSKPNYWYVNGSNREYRFKFRKSQLVKFGFDESKSEHQIMLERKLYRIYDCGNKRYEFIMK